MQIPDGKGANKFGYNNKCLNKAFAVEVRRRACGGTAVQHLCAPANAPWLARDGHRLDAAAFAAGAS